MYITRIINISLRNDYFLLSRDSTIIINVFSIPLTLWWIMSLLFVIPDSAAKEPSLIIRPTQPRQIKPIGSSLILTCQPDVDQPEFITYLKWLDPQNRTIDQTSWDYYYFFFLIFTKKFLYTYSYNIYKFIIIIILLYL